MFAPVASSVSSRRPMRTCRHVYKPHVWEAQRAPCSRPCWGDGKYCLFHSPEIDAKREEFIQALEVLVRGFGSDDSERVVDLEGFVFPHIALTFEFDKPLNLRHATFFEFANFDYSVFHGSVNMERVKFDDGVSF